MAGRRGRRDPARPPAHHADHARGSPASSSSWPSPSCGSCSRASRSSCCRPSAPGSSTATGSFFLSYVSPVMWNAAQIAFVVAAGVCGRHRGGHRPRARLGRGGRRGARGRHPGARPCARLTTRRRARRSTARSPDVQDVLQPLRPGGGRPRRGAAAHLRRPGPGQPPGGRRRCPPSPTARCSTCSRSACSAWRWRPPSCPELSRLGRAGAAAIARPPPRGHGADHVLRRHHRRRCTCSPATSSSARCSCSAASSTPPTPGSSGTSLAAFSLGLLGTTRSRLLQNGLYALDRPKLVARIAVAPGRARRRCSARCCMFPFDRLAIVDGSVAADRRPRPSGRSPTRCGSLEDGPPASASSGLALGAAASSWVEYRLLRGALEWRIGALPRARPRHPLVASSPPPACGVLAAGPAVRHRRPAAAGRRWSVVVPASPALPTSGSPPRCGCPRRRALVDRVRRLLPG